MADTKNFKLVITALVMMLTLWESTVLGRPNAKHGSSIQSNDVVSFISKSCLQLAAKGIFIKVT